MLFDPKWEVKIKADTWALPSFVAWLETQPPEKEYDYYDCRGECLIGQYMRANGISWENDGCGMYRDTPSAFRGIAVEHPRTFGGALKRARNICGND